MIVEHIDYPYIRNALLHHSDTIKRETAAKYLNYFGVNSIQIEPFYKDYLCHFQTIPYRLPEWFDNTFDCDLYSKLNFASFKCEAKYKLSNDNLVPDIEVKVVGDRQKKLVLIKTINELDIMQVNRAFEIYINEQYQIYCHCFENKRDSLVLAKRQKMKLAAFEHTKTSVTHLMEYRDKYKTDENIIGNLLNG